MTSVLNLTVMLFTSRIKTTKTMPGLTNDRKPTKMRIMRRMTIHKMIRYTPMTRVSRTTTTFMSTESPVPTRKSKKSKKQQHSRMKMTLTCQQIWLGTKGWRMKTMALVTVLITKRRKLILSKNLPKMTLQNLVLQM